MTRTTLPSPPQVEGGALPASALIAKRYEVLDLLGSGGMGIVYRARDLELDEVVALKVVDQDRKGDPEMLQRFKREVRLSRRVTHGNVARVFDIGEDRGLYFFTMELIEGESLRQRLRREKRLGAHDVIAVALAICEGLSAAHAASVVHRDLKPDNVLIGNDGRIVLTDFGIARAWIAENQRFNTQDVSVGTPEYMAPEQVQGVLDIDGRADIYALGAMMFELLTGEPPWTGPTVMAVVTARLTADPPDPRSWGPVNDALAEVVLRCLRRSPSERYTHARDVADALVASALTLPDVPHEKKSVGPRLARASSSPVRPVRPVRPGSSATLIQVVKDSAAFQLIERAQLALDVGDDEAIDRAVAFCEQAMSRAPDDPTVNAAYAGALVARFEMSDSSVEELHEALSMVGRALDTPSPRVEASLARAQVLLELGETADAVAEVIELARRMPMNPGVLSLRGRLLLAAGAVTEAEKVLAESLNDKIPALRARVDWALGLALVGDRARSDAQIDHALTTHPRSSWVWLVAARMCLWAADPVRAGVLLERLHATGVEPSGRIVSILHACTDPAAADAARELHERLAADAQAPRRRGEHSMMAAELAIASGDPARALAIAENLLGLPALHGVGWLARCPMLDPLRAAPRFALLLDELLERAEPLRTQLLHDDGRP